MPQLRAQILMVEPSQEEGLALAYCSPKAAAHAAKHWHYAGKLPAGKKLKVGVWEDGRFIGALIFTHGLTHVRNRGLKYGVEIKDVCELARVALRDHEAPVTQIISQALRLLKESHPEMKLVISYADPAQGHAGTIYQAGNWTYVGRSARVKEYFLRGAWQHNRSVNDARASAYTESEEKAKAFKEWEASLPTRLLPPKLIYLMGLDKKTKRAVARDALPYPDAAEISGERAEVTNLGGQVRSLPAAR